MPLELEASQRAISLTPDVLPDLVGALRSGDHLAQDVAQSRYAARLAGLVPVLQQRVTAATDLGPGWAPWQALPAREVLAMDGAKLLSGFAFQQVVAPFIGEAWSKLAKVIQDELAQTALRSFGDLVAVIPIVGQVVEILFSFAFAIGDIARGQKQLNAAMREAAKTEALLPDPESDRDTAEEVTTILMSGDWTRLWLPLGDPHHEYLRRAWSCTEIKQIGGKVIGVLSDKAWALDRPGFGHLLGTPRAHRRWQLTPRGGKLIDSGDWYPATTSAIRSAEGLLWSDGPQAFLVDADHIGAGWRRYVFRWVEGIDSRCKGISKAARDTLRRESAVRLGIPLELMRPEEAQAASIACEPAVAATKLAARQEALLATMAVAYASRSKVPVAIRERVIEAQELVLLGSRACELDPSTITDAVYRARVELAQERCGATTTPDQFKRLQAEASDAVRIVGVPNLSSVQWPTTGASAESGSRRGPLIVAALAFALGLGAVASSRRSA